MSDTGESKTRRVVAMDGHQVGYAILSALVVAGLVFAAGFILGQRSAPAASSPDLAERSCIGVLGEVRAPRQKADKTILPIFGYEERLPAAAPAAPLQDPAERLMAEGRDDLALPGIEPRIPEPELLAHALDEENLHPRDDAPPPDHAQGLPVGQFTLQVQAFQQLEDAQSFAARLQERGYDPYIAAGLDPGRGRLFRVRVGGFADRNEASAFKARFERAEGFETFITPMD